MQKLTMQEHNFLTENILKILAQNHITTISDFLQEDTEKLSIISKLSLPEILDIRDQILLQYSAPLIKGITLLEKNKRTFIPTHINCLDTALEGGLPVGYITELCGLAGAGKTQLCFQLAINCAKQLEYSIMYIDTKGDFSAIRIEKILNECGCNHQQMAAIMKKIRAVHVWNLEDVIQLLKDIKDHKVENLGLIIIDSLPCLMFQHLGDDNKVGLKLLNNLVNLLRFISRESRVAVVCVNIQTRWLDQDLSDIDDEEETTFNNKESIVEKRNRCLGKYWQNIPSVLIFVEKIECQEIKKCSIVQVQIYKSILPKQYLKCTIKLNEVGVSSI